MGVATGHTVMSSSIETNVKSTLTWQDQQDQASRNYAYGSYQILP